MFGKRFGRKLKGRVKEGGKAGGGVKIHISIFVWIYAFVMAALGQIGKFFSYLVAIVLHESAHAWYAGRRGYVLNEFRLMPYGAALIGEFESAPPSDEKRIAAIGPLFSLAVAIAGAALWWLIPAAYYFTADLATASLALAAVNVLPVYPLDGGRIALAVMSERMDRKRAYGILRVVGIVVGTVFAGLFVLSCFYGVNVTFMSMAVFILAGSVVPDNRCRYVRLYGLAARQGKLRRGMTVREIAVAADAPAKTLLRLLSSDRYTEFRVVDGRGVAVGKLDENALERQGGASFAGTVADVLRAANSRPALPGAEARAYTK